MKTTTRPSEEHYIKWEMDGGNYSIVDQAILYDGRLYDNERTVIAAMLKSRTRSAVLNMIAFCVPLVALMFDRK